jgi:hypothetical protein
LLFISTHQKMYRFSFVLVACELLLQLSHADAAVRNRRDSSALLSPLDTARGRKEIIIEDTSASDKFIPFQLPFNIKPDLIKFAEYFAYAMDLAKEEGGLQKLSQILFKKKGGLSGAGSFKFGDLGAAPRHTKVDPPRTTGYWPSPFSGESRGYYSSESAYQNSDSEEYLSAEAKKSRQHRRLRAGKRLSDKKIVKTDQSIMIFRLEDDILFNKRKDRWLIRDQLAAKFKIKQEQLQNLKVLAEDSFALLTSEKIAKMIRDYHEEHSITVENQSGEKATVDQIRVAPAYKEG